MYGEIKFPTLKKNIKKGIKWIYFTDILQCYKLPIEIFLFNDTMRSPIVQIAPLTVTPNSVFFFHGQMSSLVRFWGLEGLVYKDLLAGMA